MNERILLATCFLGILIFLSFISSLFVPVVNAWTPLEGHITEDTILTLEGSPYVVVNDVYVDSNARLTIEPGTEVRFGDGFSLYVNGSLNAQGNQSYPIVFTSNRIEPNPPYPGVWKSIEFTGGKNHSFTMIHCVIKYAIDGVRINGAGDTVIQRISIQHISGTGIYIGDGSNVTVKDNKIQGLPKAISGGGTASHISILNNSMNFNDNGISLPAASNIVFSRNLLTSNNGMALSLNGGSSRVAVYNNTISFNQGDGIYIGGSTIQNVTILDNKISLNHGSGINFHTYGSPSHIRNVTIIRNKIQNNSGWGIRIYSTSYPAYGILQDYSYVYDLIISNNTLSYNGGGISVTSIGTPDLVGRMTGRQSEIYNSSIFGNVLYSNEGTAISLHSGAGRAYVYNCTIEENIIYFGRTGISIFAEGYSPHHWGTIVGHGYIYDTILARNLVFISRDVSIYLHSSGAYWGANYIYGVKLFSNKLLYGLKEGILLDARNHEGTDPFDVTLYNNLITSYDHGIYVIGGIRTNSTANSVAYNQYGFLYHSGGNIAHHNDIYSNLYGMNVSGGSVDAEFNFWGDPSGPYHLSLNPEGRGNPVNGDGTDLDFIPFNETSFESINERPVASLLADKKTVDVNETITFNASASFDDSGIKYYFFDFGDGTNSGWTTLSVVKHKYSSSGVYNASLTVIDDFGVTSTNIAIKTIVVGEAPSLYVSLTLNTTTVHSEAQVFIEIHVSNGTAPVENALIQLVADKGGTFANSSGNTNSTGDFTTTYTAPDVSETTNVRITATASKTGYSDASNYKYLSVFPSGAASLIVTVTTNPTTIQSGETSAVEVQVTDGENPVPDATVVLTSDEGGTFSPSTGNTDSNGYFSSTFTAPSVISQTIITLTSEATKTGYFIGHSQAQLTVNPQPGKGNLSIHVRDSEGNPVIGATVASISQPTGQSTLSGTTDASGYATFNNIIEGSYTIQVSKTGYVSATKTEIVKPNQTTTDTIVLTKESSLELWWILSIAFVLIVVVAGSWLAVRRRGKEQ